MVQKQSDTVPSLEQIKNFIQRYVNEYRNFLEKNYPERKGEFPLYTGYPYHVIAYVDNRGTLIEYRLNADNFIIEVRRVEKKPKYEEQEGYITIIYSNRYLRRFLDEPEKIARRNITDVFAYEELQKEEEEDWEKLYEQYVQEYIDSAVEGYVSYLKTAYKSQEKTSLNMKNEIYTILKIVQNQSEIMDAYQKSNCFTLLDVIDEVIQDIESSLFLAMHGRYRPAMALLRRWLETMLVALYFDAELRKYYKSSRTYEAVRQKRDKWINKPRRIRFTGESGIVEKLIDPDTDYVAGETLRRTTAHFKKSLFRKYVEELYQKLSKFVHYGGMRPMDEILTLEFAEYNENRFKEWYTRFNQVYEICNLLTIIKFPEILSLYDERQKKLPPEDQVPLPTYQQIQTVKQLVEIVGPA